MSKGREGGCVPSPDVPANTVEEGSPGEQHVIWPCSDTVFRIPRSHWHCQFENFEWERAGVHEAVEKFIAEMDGGGDPHLILTGDRGNGKTHLSVALYRYAILGPGTQDCWWGDIPEFCRRIKEGFNTGASVDILEDATGATRFVAMDDVWGRQLTPWELDNVVFGVINSAVMNKAALVCTTNLSIQQIADVLAPHEYDRLLQRAEVVPLKGPSRRTQWVVSAQS